MPMFFFTSYFIQFGIDTLCRLVKQRSEEVVAGGKRTVRSRNVDEYFRVGGVVVECHYQLGGVVGQKVLRGVHVMSVLLVERGASLRIIPSVVSCHGQFSPDKSVMEWSRRCFT